MGTRYLIDSNILIKFQGNMIPVNQQVYLAEILDEDFNISIVSEIEVLGHHSATESVEAFVRLANIFDIDSSVKNKTIELRKLFKIKLPDAIIAATALVHNMVLVTQNEKDFVKIPELNVYNPFKD